ncbi:MAG: rRNA maturation RNase YbeY [Bacteroidetes bacterium]|nr:MAG: rRNA maturation RNase YbeY [Bacteroidota bacterium]
MRITFSSQNVSFSLKKKSAVKKILLSVIKKEKKKTGNISFTFCNDPFLLALNKKFLKHHTLTDIITFDYSSPATHPSSLAAEIFISISRVKENAKKFKISFENELHRIMIHGILHLCGYSDKTGAKKKEMRKMEDYYLNCFE